MCAPIILTPILIIPNNFPIFSSNRRSGGYKSREKSDAPIPQQERKFVPENERKVLWKRMYTIIMKEWSSTYSFIIRLSLSHWISICSFISLEYDLWIDHQRIFPRGETWNYTPEIYLSLRTSILTLFVCLWSFIGVACNMLWYKNDYRQTRGLSVGL